MHTPYSRKSTIWCFTINLSGPNLSRRSRPGYVVLDDILWLSIQMSAAVFIGFHTATMNNEQSRILSGNGKLTFLLDGLV